jgi:predicted nucleic-acid-binding protein
VKCRVIDANVVLRFLLDDPPEQAERCQALFSRIQAGKEEVYLPEVTLSDVVWTLQSFYRWPRERIARFAYDVISLTGTTMARKPLVRDAIHLYAEHRIDFSDALIAAEVVHGDYTELYSFDHDFDRIAEIKRVEP